jgi:hypothetical protein
MASEITGLEPLRGYLKLGNLVVRLSGAFIDLPNRQPKFIERPMPTHVRAEASVIAGSADVGPVPERRLVVPDRHTHEQQAVRALEHFWQ